MVKKKKKLYRDWIKQSIQQLRWVKPGRLLKIYVKTLKITGVWSSARWMQWALKASFLVLGRKNNCVFPNCLRYDANIKRFWIGFQSQLISVVPELQSFVGCCEVLWLGTVPVLELFCNLAFTLSSYFMNTTTLILETERKFPSHLLPISLCLCEPFMLGGWRSII